MCACVFFVGVLSAKCEHEQCAKVLYAVCGTTYTRMCVCVCIVLCKRLDTYHTRCRSLCCVLGRNTILVLMMAVVVNVVVYAHAHACWTCEQPNRANTSALIIDVRTKQLSHCWLVRQNVCRWLLLITTTTATTRTNSNMYTKDSRWRKVCLAVPWQFRM